jgi:hypothetical protein
MFRNESEDVLAGRKSMPLGLVLLFGVLLEG